MLYLLIAYLIVCLIGINFNKKDDNFLSKNSTMCINGIFVGIILFSHFNVYVTFIPITDLLYYRIIKKIGQLMVTTFFMYSGYGIMESVKTKKNYINNFFKNRIVKLFIMFSLSIVIWIIFNLIMNREFPISDILLSFTGWSSIGNSNWFIFATFCLYFITLISFSIFKRSNIKTIAFSLLGTIIYIVFMSIYKENYWYNTVLCYNLGMFISYYKDKILLFLKDNGRYAISFIIALLLLGVCYKFQDNNIVYLFYSIVFCLCVFLFTYKVKLGNKVLYFLGVHTFSIYVLQRISYILFFDLRERVYLYFIVSIVFTMIIVLIFDKLIGLINKKLYKNSTV